MIHIVQAVALGKGTVTVEPPKSRYSYRDVPVPPSLRCCAVFLRNTDKKFIWEAGRKDMPCKPSYLRKLFKNAVNVGVCNIKFTDKAAGAYLS